MDILAVQQRFIDAGYQFQEHVFNDGEPNCMIKFALATAPLHFHNHPCGDFGWGRFDRWECWRRAAEWLDKKEAGE
jgi:hypothetical protein